MALCFDDLNTGAAALKLAKDAAERVVKTFLAPGDRVVVVTTAQSQDSGFTGDVPKLVEQIAKVTTHQRFSDDSAQLCPRIRPYEAYLIVNHLDDQVLQAKMAECRVCTRNPCPQGQVNSMADWIWGAIAESVEARKSRLPAIPCTAPWRPGC